MRRTDSPAARYRVPLLVLILVLMAAPLAAFSRTDLLLWRAWPRRDNAKLDEVGRGVAVVFSPDLSVPGNCRFYQTLGFACFEEADWSKVLRGIHDYNLANPTAPIRTVVLETHGTNGNGLKLQKNKLPKGDRSYISVGALQERLEPDGVRYVIISACNSGRLLRPMIYRTLDPKPGDKLFLPATCGIFNASWKFNPRRSHVSVLAPANSHIETTLVGSMSELGANTRKLITSLAKEKKIRVPQQFAMSDILIQMLIRDDALELKSGGYVDGVSQEILPATASEKLFKRLVGHLEEVADRSVDADAGPQVASGDRR